MAQTVENLPIMQEAWVLYLGQEDPLENEMTTHSSILAWEIPLAEEPGRLQSIASQKSQTHMSSPITISDQQIKKMYCVYVYIYTHIQYIFLICIYI